MTSYGEVVTRLRAAGCVFAEDEAILLIDAGGNLDDLVRRRIAGEPVEHLVGWAAFAGLRIAVVPGVFVPRRRTELLARRAAALAAPGAVVVDLCCGSGAIGAVVRASAPRVELHAADISAEAVKCARTNLGDRVHQGDLYDALPTRLRKAVDVLVANAPYVPTEGIALMPPEAREHEPHATLDGGSDGLDVIRRIVQQAGDWLAPSGHLLFEVGRAQVPVAEELCRAVGLVPTVVRDEDLDGTVILAQTGA